MKYTTKDMTPDEKKALVAQLQKENPKISQRKIAEMMGISRSHVWGISRNLKPDSYPHFDTEADLESWIKENPIIVFNEKIEWLGSQVRLDKGISPDLVGVDSNGNFVIVEVKLGEPDRDAVAQILDYAVYLTCLPNPNDMKAQAFNAFFSKDGLDNELRLFIVSELVSQPVERICQYLQAHGINIQHLSVGDSIEPDGSPKTSPSKGDKQNNEHGMVE